MKKGVWGFLFVYFLAAMLYSFAPVNLGNQPAGLKALSKAKFYNPQKVFKSKAILPDAKTLQKWSMFKQRNAGFWKARWDVKSARPLSIYGKSAKSYGKDPVTAAKNFIKENQDLLKNNKIKLDGADDLKIVNVFKKKEASHVQFQQFYGGKIKVYDRGLKVNLDKQNRVILVAGNYVPDIKPVNKKKLTVTAAKEKALAALDIQKIRRNAKVKSELVVYPQKSGAVYAYKVMVPAAKPLGDWEILVDAQTGKVLNYKNRMIYFTGKGDVYKLNPVVLNKIETVKLPDMDDTYTLSGKYVKVKNEDADEALNKDRVYKYDPNDTHFDEVMVYYHMNVVHNYFKKLGFSELDKPMPATVHYGDHYDNAFFSPWSKSFAFGDGNKLNDLAREAGVIYHEYTHAVTGAILELSGDEGGAMNEGFSDYFACTITGDPKIGEWAMAKMHKPYLRYLINNEVYPDDMHGEVHADSVFWSSALWDLRQTYGAKVADILAHKCRYYMPKWGAKFIDGYEALLAADDALFKGAHKDKITEIFKKKGIVSSNSEALEKLRTEKKLNDMLNK